VHADYPDWTATVLDLLCAIATADQVRNSNADESGYRENRGNLTPASYSSRDEDTDCCVN
jgi:hypothetical protein